MTKRAAPVLDERAIASGALWGLMGASTALNAWGWAQSAPAIVALVLIALVVASEVMGMCLVERVAALFGARAAAPLRFATGLVLFVGVLAFNAYSGHRALEAVEAQRREPYEMALSDNIAASARVRRLQQELGGARGALAAIPSDIPGSRIEILQRPHLDAIERLEPELARAEAALRAATAPSEAPSPIEGGVLLAIVALIEALKALGRWTLGAAIRRSESVFANASETGKALIEELLATGRITRSDVASIHASARWRTQAHPPR